MHALLHKYATAVRCAQRLDPLTAFKKLAVEVLDQLPAVCNITLVADDALP
jgi:hypothetical protein